jgi:hypothetical protein
MGTATMSSGIRSPRICWTPAPIWASILIWGRVGVLRLAAGHSQNRTLAVCSTRGTALSGFRLLSGLIGAYLSNSGQPAKPVNFQIADDPGAKRVERIRK